MNGSKFIERGEDIIDFQGVGPHVVGGQLDNSDSLLKLKSHAQHRSLKVFFDAFILSK